MRVHVERTGTGPEVVCTHGIGATRHTFDRLVAGLSATTTVTTWDLPGHGDSEVPADRNAYDRDRVLEDLDAVVATASAPPILLGHSLGGYLSLAWATTRPGRTVGLCILATGPGFRDPSKREAWNAMSRRNAHRFGVPDQVTEMNLQHDAVVIEGLNALALPVELVVGAEDRAQLIGGMEYLAAKLPDARLTVVEGGGHDLHEGAGAEVVADAVRRLVSRTGV
jgi:pimeloyl-ACP methyl ester carboxylesterase